LIIYEIVALPKTPPTEPGIRRFAIQTEDHTLEYADFEGEIPQGQYGAGTVTIWDRGGLVVEDIRENEKILFELSGNKMQGRYAHQDKDRWRKEEQKLATL
jgi:DNA ligase D-like protein (predicted 3'-phosphoesterase)